MRVALTGATGFIGRYIAKDLASQGHSLRCWHRPSSDTSGFDGIKNIHWIEGGLGEPESAKALVEDCDAVVHAALYRPGSSFAGGEGDVIEFVEKNVLGTLKLVEAARSAGAGRFVTFSTCAVHDKILDARSMKLIRFGPRVTMAPTRQPSKSLSTATDSGRAFRFAQYGRPASMAFPTPWSKASGTTWSARLCVVKQSTVPAVEKKSTPQMWQGQWESC